MTPAHTPDGWKLMRLGDVGRWGSGGTPKRGVAHYFGGDIPWVKSGDLEDGVITRAEEHLTEDGLRFSSAKLVDPGTLLIAMYGATIGKLGIPNIRCATNQAIAFCVPDSATATTEYLFELLLHMRPQLVALGKGGAQPNISQAVLKAVEIPVPPLDVQAALVHALRQLRASSASTIGRLEKAARAVEQFRRAVVAAACSGRLTADWRGLHPGITAEEEMPRSGSCAQQVRRGVDPTLPAKPFDGLLPSTWVTYTVAQLLTHGVLEDVKDGNHGSNHPKVSEFTMEGLPFITANLVRNGRIDYDAAPRVTGSVLGRLRVGFSYPGDVILTHKGTVGRVAVATREAMLTPQTTYYRPADSLDPEYLALFFGSFLFYEQLANVMSQTTRDFVPITQQYKLTVIVPPLAEQLEIVTRTNGLLASADALAARIDAASKLVDRSSQAVLAKAFRGELSA